MTFLNGYIQQPMLIGAAPTPQAAPTNTGGSVTSSVTIDGTPVRVVILCLAAAAGIMALKAAGVKFSIGGSV